MKKLLLILTAVFAIFSFSACSDIIPSTAIQLTDEDESSYTVNGTSVLSYKINDSEYGYFQRVYSDIVKSDMGECIAFYTWTSGDSKHTTAFYEMPGYESLIVNRYINSDDKAYYIYRDVKTVGKDIKMPSYLKKDEYWDK